MSLSNTKGFTLMELMIAVAIIGIIASVGYPSYLDSVQKTKRSDARITLTEMAAAQERLFTENNSYTNAVADIGGATSHDDYYSIAVTNDSCSQTVGGKTLYSCFELIATAKGTQLQDDDCQKFTLNNLGVETSKDSSDADADCW